MNRRKFMPLVFLFTMVCLLLVPLAASADTTANITFTTPKSTDVVVVGSTINITWTWNGDPGPLNFTFVDSVGFVKAYAASNVTKGSGATSILFRVPNRDDYDWYTKHKIVARTPTGKFIAQSASFSIKAPEVTVTAPTAGFVWKAGTASTIKWSAPGQTGNGKVELVRDNQVVQVIAASVPISQGSLPWTMPTTLPAQYDDKDFVIRVWNLAVGAWGDSALFKVDLTSAPSEPHLTGASMTFNTTSENKAATTIVNVAVYSGANKKLAWGVETGTALAANSSRTNVLMYDPSGKKSDFSSWRVTVDATAGGNDLWTFNGLVTLSFSDGTKLTKQSNYERVMNSQNSQRVEVDLQGPAMTKPVVSGKTTALLTKFTNTASPKYTANYYTGTCLYPGYMNAVISNVKNNSQSTFILWFTDRLGKKSVEVTLHPGESADEFNGMSAWGGLWEAAMTLPYPTSAPLEITWKLP